MQFRLFVVAISFLLLAIAAPLSAQNLPVAPPVLSSPESPIEPEFSVEDLVAMALKNNPQLPIARETSEAARQRAGALRGLLNPTLQAVPRLAGNRGAADEELLISQPLDIFGKRRAQAAVADAERRQIEAQSNLIERSLVVQVKNAAADLFAAQEAENLGQTQLEVARLFRDAAARKAQLGDVPPVQVQRASLEVLRAENDLTNAQTERLARRAALNQLVGQTPETPLRVTLPIASVSLQLLKATAPFSTPSPMSGRPQNYPTVDIYGSDKTVVGASSQIASNLIGLREQVLPGALLNRPDVIGAQASLEARRAAVRAAGRQRLPDIELQLRRDTVTNSGGSTALRAVVTVPIFDFGSIKREKKAAQAEVRAQEAQIALLRSQVSTQVEQALLRLQQQQQTVERYRAGIVPQTIDLLRKTQIGYAAGASTYLEVLEAQRTLRQVQTEYLQSLVGVRTQEAALEGALGATPNATLFGAISNPAAPTPLPGVAEPGTVPEGLIPAVPQAPVMAPNSLLPATPARETPNP